VIGAGSLVTKNIPANVSAAGYPARIIKAINPNRRMLKRELLFKDAEHYFYNQDQMDRYMLSKNSTWNWLRSLVKPNRFD
ncbi:MAG: acetyltransferase, partial [Segetibacter sp.]|nr:acetyltransferase [Segetibacter sp.]